MPSCRGTCSSTVTEKQKSLVLKFFYTALKRGDRKILTCFPGCSGSECDRSPRVVCTGTRLSAGPRRAPGCVRTWRRTPQCARPESGLSIEECTPQDSSTPAAFSPPRQLCSPLGPCRAPPLPGQSRFVNENVEVATWTKNSIVLKKICSKETSLQSYWFCCFSQCCSSTSFCTHTSTISPLLLGSLRWTPVSAHLGTSD